MYASVCGKISKLNPYQHTIKVLKHEYLVLITENIYIFFLED